MSISFSGLASGLDTSSWVESLVALKKAKVTSLEEEKKEVQSLQETLTQIKSFFSSFRSMLEKVTDAKFGVASMDLFAQNLATSSNLEALTASATTEAEEATYNVFVDKLASETKANSNYSYMTTIIQTTTATNDSKLINLGVKAGNIGVTVKGVEHGIDITENDTISSFIEKLNKIGVKASYNENSGVFSIDISSGDIKDIGSTGIVDKLHLQGVNEGYTSDDLKTSTTDTIFSAATESTKLSELGVKAGTITVNSNDKDYSITIKDTTTIGDLINELKKNNIDANIDSEGIFTITDATIKNEGSTKILDALGLTNTVYEKSQITGNLKHSSLVVTTTTATNATLLKDLGTGTAISDNQTVIVKNSNNESKTITVGTTTTLGKLLEEFSNAGLYAALNSDGTVEIAGGTITGGTFDAVKALGLEKEPYSAIVTGKSLTETIEVHKIVTLQTKLVDELKVSEGYLEVTDANNAKHYEKIYSGQTIADFMADMGNLGINTSLDEDTGVLTITGGSFKTLSDADVLALIANGTIRETDARYKKGTNLLKCLYGADAISANQTSVASSSAKSRALRHTVTNTIDATKSTTLGNLGLSATGTAIFDIRGEKRTINVDKTMTIEGLMKALKDVGVASSWSEEHSKILIENATLTGGTSNLKNVLNLSTEISGKYITSNELYSTDTITIDATRDTVLKDYGILNSMSQADRTVTIFNSNGTVAGSTVVTENTTIGNLIDFINTKSGIKASIVDGYLKVNNGYIGNKTLERTMGLVTSNKSSYVLGSVMTVTTTDAVSGDTTLENIFKTIGSADKVKDGYTLFFNSKSINVSATTTLDELIMKIYNAGGTASMDATGRLAIDGGTLTGTVAQALGVTSVTNTASVAATGKTLLVKQTIYANRDTKFSDLGISGNTSYIVHNSLGQATTTVTLANTTSLGAFLDGLKAYQIDGVIADGVIKLDSASGQYITGALTTSLGIGTQTVSDIVNTTVYSTSAVQYTASGKADISTRLGSILAINTSNNKMVVYNSLNTAKTTITVDATTTVDQWFAMLAKQGIQAEVNQGVISFVSNNGSYVTGSIIDSFGMTPTTVTTTKTTGTTATSGQLHYTQSITATTDTTLSSLGYSGNYTISVMKPNGGTIKEEATITLNSSTTIDQLFDKLDDYGVQGIIADGIITFTSATGAYVQDKSGGLLSGMGISAMTYVQTIFVTSTIKQTITTSFKTTNTQPVQYTTTSWQTTVTIPADTVTVTVNTSGTVPGREVVVTITQEATSPTIVTYISQTTSSAPVTVNFSTTIPSQTVTHSYSTVVTQNFTVTQTVDTSQTIVGQMTSVSTTTTRINQTLLVDLEGVSINVGDELNIASGPEAAVYLVQADSTLGDLMHFIKTYVNAMIVLEIGATGRQAIQVDGSTRRDVSISGSLAGKLDLYCHIVDFDDSKTSKWFTPKKTIVTHTITTTTTINTTQTITGTKTITVSESKSTTITDSFTTVIGARTVTYSTTVPGQTLTTGGWYTFYPKKTSVTGVFTISTSSVTVDSSGTAVVKTPAHTVTIKGTSTITIPSTTTTVAGTVTVTVNTTTTATVTQTYGLNSNSNRQRYSVTLNADDTTTLTTGSGTGTISGVYQGRSFTVTAGAGKSIGEVLTELAGYGISGSISSGTVTLKGTGDGYITSISGAFGINGSNYYTTATTTIKTNKTSNEKTYTSNNVTLTTATKISSINGYSGGNGSLIIHKTDGTYATISVDASKTLGELFTQLANYGLVGRVDDSGKVSIEGIGNVYLQAATGGSNILTALKLSNVVSNVKTVTVNRTSATLHHTVTVAAKGTTTLGNLQASDNSTISFSGNNATLIISAYSDAGNKFATLTFTKTQSIYDVIASLANYGIDARIDSNGRFSVSSSTLNDFSISGTLGTFLMGSYTKKYGTDTTYNISTNLRETTTVLMKDSDALSTFGITGGNIIVNQEGVHYTVNIDTTKVKTIGDFRNLLSKYGFNSYIDDHGRLNIEGIGNSTLIKVNGGSNILDKLGLTNWTLGEITQDSDHLTDTEIITRKISMSDKLKELTNSAGVNLGITAGQIYVYQDGTRSAINIDTNDTLETLAAKLSQYGISIGISQNGQLYFDGNNDSYLTTSGIAGANASNILQKFGISGTWSTRYDSTSEKLDYTTTSNNVVSGSTKLKNLNGTDGKNLGITTGSFYVYNSGVRTTETITADMTVNDLKALLAKYGLITDIDENGSISIGAYDNTYLATSALASANSNIVSTLFAKWDFVNIYKSNHLDIPTDEIRAITRDTKLSDINEGTYKAGIITVVKDGVQTNITLTSDDTVGTLMDELALYGFESVINDKGQLMIKNTGDSLLQNYSDASKASNALTLLGIDLNSWITTNSYEGGPLEVTKTTTINAVAGRETLLSNLGVTTGEYYVFNNGVKYTAMISSDETIGSFMDTLKSFGIETSLVQGANGAVLSIVGKGDSYIKKSTSTTNSSNVVEQLFKTNKTAYEYKGLEQTSTLKTTFTAATEETLVSYFDKNASNKSEGDLTVIVNGQKNTLKITADETIGTLLQKFRDLGLEATVSNGQIMVQSGYDTMTISATGTTSKLLDNIKFEYKKDLGGYSASNNTVKSTTTAIEERTLSVASYADLNTKMGQLNISDGSLTVYRNGQKANIEVKANETFGNLRTRLSTAFSDLDLTFENGYLKIYSKNNDNVEIGSTTDTSNFGAITGIESNGSGIAKSSRELYCVNGESVLTTNGIFRRGNVKAGTFTVGNAVFNITSTTTLSDIINQINASDAANASAFWDNVEGKLVIKSRSTGAALVNIEAGTSNFTDILGFTKSEWNTDGSIKTTKMDIDTQNIGDNAKIKINGTTYTSTSNTIGSDVTRIKGLTINLKGLTKDSEVTLKVERDKESLANAVSSVVDSYNELMKNVDDAIATDGDLKNESTLKLIRNQLRNLMTSSDMGTTVFRNLDSIGIGFNSASGNNISTANSAIISLTFDKDKFFKAFDADQDAVKALIIGSANNKGVFTKVEDLVESTLKSVSGYFEATETSYSNKIRDLDKKITKANKEVDRYKARLEAKFQSMDMLIAQMQQQYSSFLTT